MTDPRDDADFEAYLDGDSPVSRRYAQFASEEPPPELDTEILEAARHAVRPNVVPLKKSPRRWMMPVTVAATIVLSFSLVMSIVFDPSVIPTDNEMQLKTLLKENDMAQAEARAPAADAIASAAPPPSMPGENAMGRAKPAKKMETTGLATQAIDMPAAGAPASVALSIDAAGSTVRDTSELLADLRALAPRADADELAAAEQSRLRRENGAFAALQSKSLPDEADLADHAAGPDADDEIGKILALFDADEEQAALDALKSFSRSRPGHPASQIYFEWSGDAQ